MTMQPQPEGLHRVRRDKVRYSDVQKEDGSFKEIPADEYNILLKDKTPIGYTKRAAKAKGWYAFTPAGKSLKETSEGLPEPYKTHGEAMAALGESFAAQHPAQSVAAPAAPVPEPPTEVAGQFSDGGENIVAIPVEAAALASDGCEVPEELLSSVAETEAILAEPDTMAAIAEGMQDAPPQSGPQLAETDDWLAPAPVVISDAGYVAGAEPVPPPADVFEDPFAMPVPAPVPPAEDDRNPVR